ncbi:MAG: C1 family peptidase [Bacteroidales bacterium]|nr:C1 family peptidase [Bacteroidales bacterium]
MKKVFLLLGAIAISATMFAQKATDKASEDEGYKFTITKELPITSVKNQKNAGTCWCYSGLAFIEAELLRMGKGEYDFSEMYIVNKTYHDRAQAAVRTSGDVSFSQGGAFNDVIYGMKHYGLVPESEMRPGVMYGDTLSDHSELSALTDAMVAAMAKAKKKQKSKDGGMMWLKAVDAVHDIYLGKCPERFTYNGVTYTPKSFYESTGLNADDYVSITSYTHHPFYEQFVLEIQDNWRWGLSYNVPLDEMMEIFDYAIENGYPVAWGSDVSEQGFRMGVRKGFCVLPATDGNAAGLGSDQARWSGMSAKDIQDEAANHPTPQRWVTQEERQDAYDNGETTDDHGMLIYGTAKDQMGNEYYMVKNSWGDYGDYHGIFYCSKAFVRYKTMNIVVHKDAIPPAIKAKLGIQDNNANAGKKGKKK